MTFDPTGEFLATAGQDDALRLWSVSSGKVQFVPRQLKGPRYPDCVRFSPDGTKLLAGQIGGQVFLGRRGATLNPRVYVRSVRPSLTSFPVAFNPDGRTIATAAGVGRLQLWDALTNSERLLRKRVIEFGPDFGSVHYVVFTPDGRHILTANGNGTVYVLRLKKWSTASVSKPSP